MRKFQTKDNAVAKLVRENWKGCARLPESMCLTSLQFAKHMKVEEQVDFLKNKKTGIAVGTPMRLIALIDNGKKADIACSSLQLLTRPRCTVLGESAAPCC